MDRTPPRRYKKTVLRSACQVLALGVLGALLYGARPASVEAQRAPLGNGAYALPGAYRVGYPVLNPETASAAASVHYGSFGAALRDDDSHNRVGAGLGLGLTPWNWLGFALRLDGRYDWHHTASQGDDDGYLGHTRLLARAGGALGRDFRLGGETAIWFPAANGLARSVGATSVDLNLLASYLPSSRPVGLSALVGFRLDQTAGAIRRAAELSPSDRLALGYSESNAALFGLVMTFRLTALELFGEWSWDYYLRESSEVPVSSPMRLAAGARYWPGRPTQLQLLVGMSPTARPDLGGGELMVVEPRFFVNAQIGFLLPFEDIVPEPEPEPIVLATLQGRVIDPDGRGIAGALVTLGGPPPQQTTTDGEGNFRLDDVQAGPGTLSVSSGQWRGQKLEIDVRQGENPPLTITLEPEAMILRGAVLAPSGAPIPGARVWIGSGEERIELTTGDDGRYRFDDLPAEQLELGVSAEGFAEHTRSIDAGAGGLLELDLELSRFLPQGQIRGQVSDFAGKPLAASIEIKPLGKRIKADARGAFEVDVPPGDYRVVVKARGHRTQERKARVEENGVVVLVVNLRRTR
jgi:hypothetical protein